MLARTSTRSGTTAPRRRCRRPAAIAIAVLSCAALLATACVPPAVGVTSPFYGAATQVPDGHWEATFVGCTGGGGPVVVSIRNAGFGVDDPYRIEVFEGLGFDPASRILAADITETFDATATSPVLAPGSCFSVRIRSERSPFNFEVRWCTEGCTVVPTPPEVSRFVSSGGPFTAPAFVPVSWKTVDPNSDPLTCRIDVGDDGIWDVEISDCPRSGGRNLELTEGQHRLRFSVDDGTHPPDTATMDVVVADGPDEPFDITVETPAGVDAQVATAIGSGVEAWESVLAAGIPDEYRTSPAASCWWEWPAFDGPVDDVVIRFFAVPLDGPGGTAGTAGGCGVGADGLQRLGLVLLDTADLPALSAARLSKLVAHEIGHVLLHGADRWWSQIDGGATDAPRFTGPRARNEWSLLGGTSDPPIQPNDLAHWSHSLMHPELMTGGGITETAPLSRVTVAALGDVGYHVDPDGADPFELP